MSQIGDLNVFIDFTDALATEVNANFSDVKSAHNDTDTSVNNILNNALTLNGPKTFAGAATFNSSVTAAFTPTIGGHLTNKTYVDAQLTALTRTATQISFTPAGSISATNVQAALVELDTDVSGKAAAVHTHDDRYYTETEMDSFLAAKSDVGHTHTSANITDFNEAAQDAVGNILTDSTTIDFTYTDGSNTITAAFIWPSGVTGSRPGTPVTGQMYFDTTLTLPIWYSGSGWIKADGTSA